MSFSTLALGLVLSVTVVCQANDDLTLASQVVMPALDDYVKVIVEREISSILTKWKNSQKLQDAKIQELQSQIHRERRLRKYLETRLDILEEEKRKTTFDISAERQKNATEEETASGAPNVLKRDRNSRIGGAIKQNVEDPELTRRLIGADSHNTVAFYAYMSHNLNAPSAGHVLVFDVVKTNVGSAYNHHDGIFTAPSTGSFVFSWTVTSWYHSYVYSELMVNSSSFGKIITNSQDIEDEHVGSSVVVAALNQGDIVYVRVAGSGGTLASTNLIYTSFSGWKLS